MRRFHVTVISGLAAALVALPSVRNGFVEDDRWVVEQRPLLQHPPSLAAVLAEPYWPKTFRGALWRPATLASYALDYRFSASPRWFHAINVVWAAAAAALLALLAAELAGPLVGLVTGLLFAVHPVHVEATVTVVGRAELIAAAGYALALLCALRVPKTKWWLVGVVLATALAIGAKEHAATLPVAILLVYALRGERMRAAAPAVLAAALPILGYLILRSSVVGGAVTSGGVAPGLEGLSAVQRGWVMLPISLEWWRLLLFPAHLSADYSPAQVSVATGLSLNHLLAFAVWAAAAWAVWRFWPKDGGREAALGLGWLGLTLLPVANLVAPSEILVAERTLYLPVWGVVFAVASVGVAAAWPRRVKVAMLAVLVLAGAARSVVRVAAWRDTDHWYQALQHDAPRSYRTLWLQGNEAFRANQWGSGERLLRAAMAAAPGIPGPREDLAGYYASAGLWPQAALLLEEAMALNETRARPWMLMPRVLLGRGDTAAAVDWAVRAAARFPDDADVATTAISTLLTARRCDAAAALLARQPDVLSLSADSVARRLIADCHGAARPAPR